MDLTSSWKIYLKVQKKKVLLMELIMTRFTNIWIHMRHGIQNNIISCYIGN